MTKAEPVHVRDARRKRAQLFDYYASMPVGPAKVAELLGIDITEAARELLKRRASR